MFYGYRHETNYDMPIQGHGDMKSQSRQGFSSILTKEIVGYY